MDRDRDARDLLAAAFQREGAAVATAATVSEARALLRASRVHILVIDIGSPQVDGCSLLGDLRASGSTIPAVALTSTDAHVAAAREAGFDENVTKPIDVDAIVQLIARLVATAKHRTSARPGSGS